MRTIASTLVLGALLAACGGEEAASPPPQAPTPPPAVAPPADTTPPPAPVADTPPPAPAPSASDKTLAALKAMGDAINSHDASKVAALYTPDATIKAAGTPPSGRDAVTAEWTRIFSEFPDAKTAARRVFVKDNTGVLEWTMTGTNTGPGPMGAKSTGKAIGFYGLSVFTFNDDGLVKEERVYFDMPTMMGQLGMAPKGAPKAREVAALPSGAPEVHVAKGTPEETANVEKAKGVDKAFETHDEKTFLDANADEIVWDDLAAPGPTNGKKDAQKMFAAQAKAFPDMKLTCTPWGFDDWVVQECVMNGTNKGALVMGPMKVGPTNKPVEFHGVDVMQIKDGKATRGWSYTNGMEFAVQMGLMKPPKAPGEAGKGEAGKKGGGAAAPAPAKGDTAKAPAKDTKAPPAKK
jgi:steroid delta-isomerase-like uncharacterized protein